jgi:cation diffusion facilitator CzcD-associated flavoprotein CzcO
VTHAKWNEESGKWNVLIDRLQVNAQSKQQSSFEDCCDILINACGYLNNWKWPQVPGLYDFKGKLLHSANWDEGFQLSGRTVGLIGNG